MNKNSEKLAAEKLVSLKASNRIEVFWSGSIAELKKNLNTDNAGLSSIEARKRLALYGKNTLKEKHHSNIPALLLHQFSSPIVLILLTAALLAFAVHDHTDSVIIFLIVLSSAFLGFWQEYSATSAVEKLMQLVELKADVLRDGKQQTIPMDELVPGDCVQLSAGSAIPADCRLLAARDLFVNEASLTGETFPMEKKPNELLQETELRLRNNIVYLGTHVVSGTAQALVVHTGRATEFGSIAQSLRIRAEETEFETGVRRFGGLLVRIILVLVLAIFAINVYLHRPVLDSFLFALALAVGLTPELLPAIINVNLAAGARRMAAKKVIVKRLASIENFGSMDVLCTDKTGTLTEGVVHLDGALGVDGNANPKLLRLAAINAILQTGFQNPIDQAIQAVAPDAINNVTRLDEIPYDFIRKRLSVLAKVDGENILIVKGALEQVLSVCTTAETADGQIVPLVNLSDAINERFVASSERGLRTLGLAVRKLPDHVAITRDDEKDLTFIGFLLFVDPPKAGVKEALAKLTNLGVTLKIITGDNHLVAKEIARQVGFEKVTMLTGAELHRLSDDALPKRAMATTIFAEVEPNQKERLIHALRKGGHVVGYLGDGINDAPALHAADVGLSVQGAVDVAKDAADIVLMEANLNILVEGVLEGRRTFANTLKYVFMATSANFGNMFSMAGASLLLPFLPLLPKQIMLTNLLTDLPEMAISSDNVDDNLINRPRRWDVKFIRDYMLFFGLLSSVFDFITFAVLLFVLHATPELFRSGWFVESVVSATLIVLIIRTRGSFIRSRPSPWLAAAAVLITLCAVTLPYTALGAVFGFVALPPRFLLFMGMIVLAYIVATECLKHIFYRRHNI